LNRILSPENPAYMRLIEEQQRGEFRSVCKSCDYYKSIYHTRKRQRVDGTKFQTIEEYKNRLRETGQRGGDVVKELTQAPIDMSQPGTVAEAVAISSK